MILVTGGAGYIGSHTNKALNKAGYDTLVLDNLSCGYENFVKWGKFINCDFGSYDKLKNIFSSYDIEGVIHFAAFSSVAESVKYPAMYLKNNYKNTLNLLKVMKEFKINNFILSSTAAVYGNPEFTPIPENHPLKPINPYGKSKLLVEKALKKQNLDYVSLRYFNAAGCDFDLEIGELHVPETHLIPLTLDAAIGKSDSISIYGDDYNTSDGTCIRDYVHVNDLADAHIKALEYLIQGGNSNIFNLGNGHGFSVWEVINTCKKITDIDFNVTTSKRRLGDPDILVADFTKIKETLNWSPKYDLDIIVESAWNWHKKINSE